MFGVILQCTMYNVKRKLLFVVLQGVVREMVDQMEMAITQVSSAYKHSSTQPFINIEHFYMPVEHSYVKTI